MFVVVFSIICPAHPNPTYYVFCTLFPFQVIETCCRPHMACGPLLHPSNSARAGSGGGGAGAGAGGGNGGSGGRPSSSSLSHVHHHHDKRSDSASPTASAPASGKPGGAGEQEGVAGRGGGGGGGSTGGDGQQRVLDDRLQRPVRKLVRERNGIRVLVGLLTYRRQAAAADSVRLRSALCLLGLAHDGQIAQVGFG